VSIGNISRIHNDRIVLISNPGNIPDNLKFYLTDAFNYYYDFSSVVTTGYYANHCKHCKTIQGNNYLYDETNGPFYFYPQSKFKVLKFYKIDLESDMDISGSFIFGKDGTIPKQECSGFVDLDIKLIIPTVNPNCSGT